MGKILDSIAEWLKEVLVGGIVSNLSGMFDSVNQQVGDIAGQVGATPQGWNATIYNMIHTLSDNVIMPNSFKSNISTYNICFKLIFPFIRTNNI